MKKMMMKTPLLLLVIVLQFSCSAPRQGAPNVSQKKKHQVEKALAAATQQYKELLRLVPAGRLPRTFEKGVVKTTSSDGWVSGFYPGTLLYLYEYSGDTVLQQEALQRMKLLEKEQFNKRTHDLGFMMYCSFGNARRLQPQPYYDTVLVNAARSLLSRFSPVTGCIRSWDSKPGHYLVIIDNMMNLELLLYAFRVTGDSSFYRVAVTHANTTLQHHFRPDHSSYHVVDYQPETGIVQKKHTHQGAADSSAWARGQAWGLYGYTMMYRETGIPAYLEQARRIAGYILGHPNLPADKVPYWDFHAPGIPGAYRDASAGAITSSALLELAQYVTGREQRQYWSAAETMLLSLAAPPYKTMGTEEGGFILRHSVGHLPAGSEIDVPLSYADYYFTEAALRYLGRLKVRQKSLANKTFP